MVNDSATMDKTPQSSNRRKRAPPGVKCLQRGCLGRGESFSMEQYQASVLILTFIAYAMYHLARKPTAIVKSVLDPVADGDGGGETGKSGWAPFDGSIGRELLGEVDVAFLAAYAFGMYFSGHLGDRLDLRLFLGVGMIGSGVAVCLFGMGYFWNIHYLSYYLFIQVFAGLFQSTGWPSVVTFVANWFGKSRRGLIMGIWNAHTSVGNILGALLPAAVLHWGWGWSFIFPGLTIMFGGVMVIMFLVVEPEDVGLSSVYDQNETEEGEGTAYLTGRSVEDGEEHVERKKGKGVATTAGIENGNAEDNSDKNTAQAKGLMTNDVNGRKIWGGSRQDGEEDEERAGGYVHNVDIYHNARESIGFVEAWKIPGVASYALCLFFSKLVAYTFLYWLPFYVQHTEIAGRTLTDSEAGDLSTLFDVGGIVGGVIAGYLSDQFDSSAVVATTFLYLSIPVLYAYSAYGGVSLILNVVLMVMAGLLVNGPYSLITTAVSADLGTHESLMGNSKALATVTAIIDGTGSIGAAVGPLMTGFLAARGGDEKGWVYVFWMLMASAFIAGLLLTRLVIAEIREKIAGKELYRVLEPDVLGVLVKRLLSESS